MFKELSKLVKIIKKNKNKDRNISYTASLFKNGKYGTCHQRQSSRDQNSYS